MKIAITGATGHLGGALIPILHAQGHALRILVRTDNQEPETDTVSYVKGSLHDTSSLSLLVKDCDAVIHAAALISVAGSQQGKVESSNIEGTRNMLKAATSAGVKRFIYTSSIHAYQQFPYDQLLDETRPDVSENGTSYERSKAAAQALVKAANGTMETLSFCPTSMIGPPDRKPSLLGKAMIDLYRGKIPMLIPGGFDFVDVRDCAEAIAAGLEKGTPGEKYLLSGKYHSIYELAALVGKASGKKIQPGRFPVWAAKSFLPLIHAYARVSNTAPVYTRESIAAMTSGNRYISSEKARLAFGFQSRPLEESITDTIQWYKTHQYIA